jgi:hypothetical protein
MALNLTYRSSTNCVGWSNPSLVTVKPVISSLSGYYSPAGSTTMVVLYGTNFRNFSRIQFGTFNPVTVFISSNQIEFYVPIAALPGTYPIQVFNDTLASNVVMYSIDNASGFWFLDLPTQRILNTNFGGVTISKPTNPIFGSSLISYADKNLAAISTNCNTDTTTSTYLNIIPQVQSSGDFNLSTLAGDSLIMNYVNNNGSASAINLTFWNTGAASGVRITPSATTVSGDLTVTGTIFCNSMFPLPIPIPSDYRIKENITLLDNSYTVDDLKPVKYFNTKTNNEEIGFIAHEVQEVFPFLVHGEKDGEKTQTLNYIGMIGVLVKEIQDLKKEVKDLKEKMTSCCALE